MVGGFAGEQERRDGERGDGGAGAADFNDRDAGNDGGGADGDEEFVGAGGDRLEDVFVADVRVRWNDEGHGGEQQKEIAEEALHRWTQRIQWPKRRPTQVEAIAQRVAVVRPLMSAAPWSGWKKRRRRS